MPSPLDHSTPQMPGSGPRRRARMATLLLTTTLIGPFAFADRPTFAASHKASDDSTPPSSGPGKRPTAAPASADQAKKDVSAPHVAKPEAILVTATAAAADRTAIQQKRVLAGITDSLSAEDLRSSTTSSIADSLGKIPGVGAIVNQTTGQGQYVTIRGLAGTYNNFMLNGAKVASTNSESRDVSLNLLQPYGMSGVTVSKTQTPDMMGDAIAGSIDFKTPTAFDFKKPQMLRVYSAAGYNDSAMSQDQSSFGGQIQVDGARRFLNDRLGVYLSGYYVVDHTLGQEIENDGAYRPYHEAPDSTSAIDFNSLQLPGIDLAYRRTRQARVGGSFAVDYHEDIWSAYLHGQYARLQVTGNLDTTEYNNTGNYYNAAGIWDPTKFLFGREFQVEDDNQYLANLQGGGKLDKDRFHLTFNASVSRGQDSTPNEYSVEYDKTFDEGISWSHIDPRFPTVTASPFANAVQYNPALLPLDGASLERSATTNTIVSTNLDIKYDVNDIIKYFKGGFQFRNSTRSYYDHLLWQGDFSGTSLDGLNLAQSGLIDRTVNQILSNRYYYGAIYSRDAVINAIRTAMQATPGAGTSAASLYGNDTNTTERVFSGYLMTDIELGRLSLIGGLRYERRNTESTFFNVDGDTLAPASSYKGYGVFLPSITANLPVTRNLLLRGAIWTGYSAPEYAYLSGSQTVTRNPGTGNIIAISQGNPNLKAARALNFDLSGDYYMDANSMISVAGYYKQIRNFIFTNGDYVPATNEVGSIDITQPENGKKARLYGIEFSASRTLLGLIPHASPLYFLDGFGVSGNVTFQRSSANSGQSWRTKDTPLVYAPNLLYNMSLNYRKYGVDARLSLSYRGKYLESLRSNQLDKWVQHNRNLSLHVGYNITRNIQVAFDGNNLLNDWAYFTTRGEAIQYQKDYIEFGRTFLWHLDYAL
ncbi:TonB-dependent receptor [Gluconacetobacter sp. 1b LMG 1731]|uniref:TonB-dependent receptor n=1 Tax=Gluconacetobacter dulcium TaxID=2729096 RepID=A0A7W4NVJ3_9PROT|nr:TonB-dependent receptor [Gluconacetobacter dulcium]MBB2164475.1 TonB-dependent receptor [Gluconacetobacter dulcium]MBB2193455.1 TonB-dependent receptor [Gluconacetobacter dulcium]